MHVKASHDPSLQHIMLICVLPASHNAERRLCTRRIAVSVPRSSFAADSFRDQTQSKLATCPHLDLHRIPRLDAGQESATLDKAAKLRQLELRLMHQYAYVAEDIQNDLKPQDTRWLASDVAVLT